MLEKRVPWIPGEQQEREGRENTGEDGKKKGMEW